MKFDMTAKVRFTAISGFCNDFLNVLSENNICLFDIVFEQFGFKAVCYAEDYRILAKLARKHQVKVRITEKKGIVFRLRFLLKRKGILTGAIIFTVLLYLFSNIVWDIHIYPESQPMKDRISVRLFNRGVYPGVFYTQELISNAQKSVMKDVDGIKYISVNFYKGIITCEIHNTTEKRQYLGGLSEDNIYAGMSGIVTDLRVYEGYSEIELGQSVSEGDILVSSSYTDKHNNVYTGFTRAYIEALCYKSYVVEIPFDKSTEILTGKMSIEKEIYMLGNKIKLKTTDDAVKNTSLEKSEIEYVSFMGFHLPATIKNSCYYEYRPVSLKTDSLTARKLAQTHIDHMIMTDEKLKQEISRQFDYQLKENSLVVFCHINGIYEIT